MPLEAISAPYNFVPLSDWVHCPEWADKVSHDIPFRDGLSGHLDLTLRAHTPILIGREQQRGSADATGEVHPYQLPDGRYALPGTALKGMIRNVVEIASFSRMGAVDDVRYGLRDISGPYVSAAYTAKVRDRIQTGFMRLGGDGLPRIIPCAMVRLDHRALEEWLDLPKKMVSGREVREAVFPADRSVKKKYETWLKRCQKAKKDPAKLAFAPSGREATALGDGATEGVPVFTGQISDSTKTHGKRRDFVFYDARSQETFAPTRQEWNDFLFVHGDQASKDAEAMSWPGYWKQRYWRDEEVPVFFLRDGGKTRIGLAYMPRLAGDFSITELRAHTSPEHGNGQGRGPWDFAEALFGAVGERPESCLKGRVTFHHAIAEGDRQPQATKATILNGPKASYFPNYLKQKAGKDGRLTANGYATCLATAENPRPELRGWKRYPARPDAKVQPLTDEQLGNKRVQVVLNSLPAGTVFTTRVSFHNLLPEEFGALCWALTWGGAEELHHSLGMGKPFGFGQLAVEITGAELSPNQPGAQTPTWEEACEAFIAHMDERHREAKGGDWRASPQIKALLGMADLDKASQFKGELRHMRLEAKKKINEFTDAKQAALVLAEYPRREHSETLGERKKRQQEQEREAKLREEAEAVRRAEEAERARLAAEFNALPGELKQIKTVEKRFAEYRAEPEINQRQQREAFMGELNRLAEAAQPWKSADRLAAADLLARIYDTIGWADPGQKKDKREKQERKRRARIDALRSSQGHG